MGFKHKQLRFQILCVLPEKAMKASRQSTENTKHGDPEESESVEVVLNLLGQKYYVLMPKSPEMPKVFDQAKFSLLFFFQF